MFTCQPGKKVKNRNEQYQYNNYTIQQHSRKFHNYNGSVLTCRQAESLPSSECGLWFRYNFTLHKTDRDIFSGPIPCSNSTHAEKTSLSISTLLARDRLFRITCSHFESYLGIINSKIKMCRGILSENNSYQRTTTTISLEYCFKMAVLVSLVIWDENPRFEKKIDDCFIRQSIMYWVRRSIHFILWWN